MRLKIYKTIALTALLFSISGLNTGNTVRLEKTTQIKEEDKILYSIKYNKVNKIKYVFDKFKVYNPKIDPTTVEKFIEVVEYFNLDTTKQIFDACIYQICLESKATHYKPDGNVIVSELNTVGITQITRVTAFHYLRNIIGVDGIKELKHIGVKNYSFVFNYPANDTTCCKTNLLMNWLSDIDNDIALWGFIMNDKLECTGYNINNALIAYNVGLGGFNKYISSGNKPNNHDYVKSINKIKKNLNN